MLHQIQYFMRGLSTLGLTVMLSKEKILSGDIEKLSDQHVDIFTNVVASPRINYLRYKLGTYDLYAPA